MLAHDGYIYVLCYTNSYGSGGYDIFLARIDPSSGYVSWLKTIGSIGDEYACKIALTKDLYLIATGYSNSYRVNGYSFYTMLFGTSISDQLEWSDIDLPSLIVSSQNVVVYSSSVESEDIIVSAQQATPTVKPYSITTIEYSVEAYSAKGTTELYPLWEQPLTVLLTMIALLTIISIMMYRVFLSRTNNVSKR